MLSLNSPCYGVIVISKEKDKVALVQEKPTNFNNDSLMINTGFPKGKCKRINSLKRRETIYECAKRELFEESGLTFEQLDIVKDFWLEDRTQKGNLSTVYLVALYSSPNDHNFTYEDYNELCFSGWKTIEEAKNILRSGRKKLLEEACQKVGKLDTVYIKGNSIITFIEESQKKEKEEVINKNKQISVSKSLSWILRHGLIDLELNVDSAGFICIDELLSLPQMKDISFEMIKKVVDENEKKRFELKQYGTKYFIRASQGHSKDMENIIDDNKLLKKITTPLPICIHGTNKKAWTTIQKDGLKVMNRMHIHFTSKLPNDKTIISGMRNDCNVIIYIDMNKAMNDGIEFFMSSNEVILSKGNNGVIEPKYFDKVM